MKKKISDKEFLIRVTIPTMIFEISFMVLGIYMIIGGLVNPNPVENVIGVVLGLLALFAAYVTNTYRRYLKWITEL